MFSLKPRFGTPTIRFPIIENLYSLCWKHSRRVYALQNLAQVAYPRENDPTSLAKKHAQEFLATSFGEFSSHFSADDDVIKRRRVRRLSGRYKTGAW